MIIHKTIIRTLGGLALLSLLITPKAWAVNNAGKNLNGDVIAQAAQNTNFNIISWFLTDFIASLQTMSHTAFSTLAGPTMTIISYTFGCSIIFYTVFFMLGQMAVKEYGKNVIIQGTILLFATLTLGLHGTQLYWSFFYDKPLEITADIATTLMKIGQQNITSCSVSGGGSASIMCIAQNVETALSAPIKLAFATIGAAGKGITMFNILSRFNIIISNLIAGMAILGIYMAAMIYIAISLADVVMQISILSSLAPLFIAMLLTKFTRGYAITACNKLLAGFVHIIGIAMATGIMNSIIAQTAGKQLQGNSTSSIALGGTMQNLMGTDPQLITIFSKTFAILFFIGFFYIMITNQISQMLEKIMESHHNSMLHDYTRPVFGQIRTAASAYFLERAFGSKEISGKDTKQPNIIPKSKITSFLQKKSALKNRSGAGPGVKNYINPLKKR